MNYWLSDHSPRVSIGLGVYNGEKFLAEAIESILAQSYGNFKLIISDNCSTDRTPEICKRYASCDPRISFSRNEYNLGAVPNFNHIFSLSTGEFFKWAAHDDVLMQDYLKNCLAALEENPKAVLCQSLIQYIDENGENLGIYDSQLHGTKSSQVSTRFAAITLLPHPCNEIYGLIRRQALTCKNPLRLFHGADRALLAELALHGQFIQLREPLLKMRLHPTRYTESCTRPEDRLSWHDTQRKGKIHLPTWQLFWEYFTIVRTKLPSSPQRVRCYGHLLRWWFRNWNWARMIVDLVAVIAPGTTTHAERVKQRLFSPRPGTPRRKEDQTVSH